MSEHHDDLEQMARIEAALEPDASTRRAFLAGAAAATAAAVTFGSSGLAFAGAGEDKPMAALPPTGFSPFAAPGKVVRVSKKDCLQTNQMYPKPDDAKAMLEKALCELSGKSTMTEAVQQFVHKDDIVVVKVNGIGMRNMSTNKELVLPFLEAMIASGVKAENITVLEQWSGYLDATRISAQNVPAGVKIAVHGNGNATMPDRLIPGTGTRTKFTKYLTEATAAINFALIKDHGICGYTGSMKNMTHGCSVNPQDFHVHHASPQIAQMYAQDVIKSRVRLNITDGFKIMADGGPLWRKPEAVKPHESIYVSTDPVAMDVIGCELVEKLRLELKLKSLADAGRSPDYLKAAGDLGLGIYDRSKITLKEVAI